MDDNTPSPEKTAYLFNSLLGSERCVNKHSKIKVLWKTYTILCPKMCPRLESKNTG